MRKWLFYLITGRQREPRKDWPVPALRQSARRDFLDALQELQHQAECLGQPTPQKKEASSRDD